MWKIEFAKDALSDLELIFDHLTISYLEFGESEDEAEARAAARVQGIYEVSLSLSKQPFRGTLRPELGPNMRSMTDNKAIYWFTLDEALKRVRVLAIFFGGQDHIQQMLARQLVR